ncbi:hypothetical protein OUZ56_029184 [Daphnia magna]|uniref:Uncharacterized protein n=1 Tax=Daphnia magna TaxID=35525 RepID=A0ABR0B636_9CRUS|nr:hypothetical protein OUZ56_029184 [Daphnia magna]
MPYNASFSAPKPLPGSKKEFPKVSARVYSFSKPEHLLKPRDSGNVTESEKTVPSAPGRVAIRTAQRWDNTTKVTGTTNIKPLPGTKKTLEDFVRKPFKATPVPASTYKAPADHLAPKTKPQTKIVKKAIAKEVTEIKKVLPFRANPVRASTYKPHIAALSTAGRSANNSKLKGTIAENLSSSTSTVTSTEGKTSVSDGLHTSNKKEEQKIAAQQALCKKRRIVMTDSSSKSQQQLLKEEIEK